jgi:hypothetical protein
MRGMQGQPSAGDVLDITVPEGGGGASEGQALGRSLPRTAFARL